MSATTKGGVLARAWFVLFSLSAASLISHPAQVQAQPQPLTYFKNYFVPGDYVVRGVSLWRKGVNGKAKVQIPALGGADGVPARGDILAAFLYIQTAEKIQGSGINHAKLNNFDFGPFTDPATPNDPGSGTIAKALNWEQATLPCWSVNFPGGRRLVTYRADVLRFLPIDRNTGKQSLTAKHEIEVPDSGLEFGDDDESAAREPANKTGPRAVGASLVVVYRERSKPFKGIVIYDGGFTKRAFQSMEQRLEGFYQAKNGTSARMTHIVGDGRPFLLERVKTSGLSGPATAGAIQTVTNPFVSAQGPKWDNWTTSLTLAPSTSNAVVNGVRVAVEPITLLSDCLSWSGMILSTPVQDADDDGLLDVWESSTAPLSDPNGITLPNLALMGASRTRKDLFIEIGYMFTNNAENPYTYGGTPKPHHDHLPSYAALEMIGKSFGRRGVNISVHFDVGDNYQGSPYIIPTQYARGGEAVDEHVTTQCEPDPRDPPEGDPSLCQFSEYPGTVGWKNGFRLIRDQPIGPPPVPGAEDPCDAPPSPAQNAACERRFDRNRKDMFHYSFFAHAIGMPKDPCFLKDAAGNVVFDANGNPKSEFLCNTPDFHVPRTNSGIADFPGGDGLIALGAFENADGLPIGTDYMQAGTLMHEWGHNFELTHAGPPKFPVREPNCKPNYLSVMNYLFQLRGLLLPLRTLADGTVVVDDALGTPVPQVDYSGAPLQAIPEPALADAAPFTGMLPYRTGWYAPKETSYLKNDEQFNAASKHCDGSDLSEAEEADRLRPDRKGGMVRIDAFSLEASKLDWQANGSLNDTNIQQDVNFNGGAPTTLNQGDNDWAFIRLKELGGRRSVGGFYKVGDRYFIGPLSLDIGRGDIGRGDIGRGDIGRGDIGRGDIGRGDIGRGDIGRGDIGRGDIGNDDTSQGVEGRGDIGRGDIGRGEFGGGDMDVGAANEFFLGELDFETFIAATGGAPTPPNSLRACLTTTPGEGAPQCSTAATASTPVRLNWDAPNVGRAINYKIYRFSLEGEGAFIPGTVDLSEDQYLTTVSAYPYEGPAPTTYVDIDAANGTRYVYYIKAGFDDDTNSGISNFAVITTPGGIN